jgi:hypothetical protein
MKTEHWFYAFGASVLVVVVALAVYNRLPSFGSLTVSTVPKT